MVIMKVKCFILFFLCFGIVSVYSQSALYTYALPPAGLIVNDPPLAAPMRQAEAPATYLVPSDYTIGHNTDFTVSVKKENATEWTDLFEYNTFVNKSLGDLTESSRSSFVSFDFSGSVTVKITCNNYTDVTGKITVRPLSRTIIPVIEPNAKNTFTFNINDPSKYSVEIDGHRYNNLQIFANALSNYAIKPTITYEPGVSYYNESLNSAHKKIHIKPGAVLIVPYLGPFPYNENGKIIVQDNDEIYIEAGGVLKGGIIGRDVKNVKIFGRGMIDISNYPKQYDADVDNYAYIRGVILNSCNNLLIDGITISDSQQCCIEIDESYDIRINDVKLFSRAKWGDGIHMQGTSNVTINDCYNRNSDDCIAIYCSRHGAPPYVDEDKNTTYLFNEASNITVTNTLLYADRGHPIEIGFHGDNAYGHELKIQNLYFEDIDILEHDELWLSDGNYNDVYTGAISINCSDNIVCNDFVFKNINVEDFSNGRLLSVNVEPEGSGAARANGKSVTNIRFENLSYNGYGERPSSIKGIDAGRYVKEVYFENFKVNGRLIRRLGDYKAQGVKMIATNRFAYKVTFQENDHWYNFIRRMFKGKKTGS